MFESTDSLFSHFASEAFLFGEGVAPVQDEVYASLCNVSPLQRQSMVVTILQTHVASALDVPKHEIAVDVPLNTLITDSLAVVRLHRLLVPDYVEISLLQFWQMTIIELAEGLNDQLDHNRPTFSASTGDLDIVLPTTLQDEAWQPISAEQEYFFKLYQKHVSENPAILQLNFALQILSPVNEGVLHAACQTVTDRHDALRLVFQVENGRCYQKVRQHADADFRMIDACDWTHETLREAVQQQTATAWALESDLGVKFRLYQLGEQNALFHIVVNHLVMDGASVWMLLDEIQHVYRAIANEQPITLPPIGRSFLEHNARQRERLQGRSGSRLRTYWQQETAGELSELGLSADFPSSSSRGAMIYNVIDAKRYAKIRNYVDAGHINHLAFFLAATQIALYKQSDRPEVRLVSRLANRVDAEVANTVGMISTLGLVRVHLSDEMRLNDVYELAQQKVLGMLANQEYPFWNLVEDLGIETVDGSVPLANVLVTVHRMDATPELAQLFDPTNNPPIDFGGLSVRQFEGLNVTTWLSDDVAFEYIENGQTMVCMVYYRQERFTEGTIQALIDDIKWVSDTMATHPDKLLGAFTL